LTSPTQTVQLQTHSPQETLELGQRLGRSLSGGLVIALVGDLGAGKTQFVKGVASGNGATDPKQVTSPTFTLINEYEGQRTLIHIDTYRLKGSAELVALGFDEFIAEDAVVAVEWADRVCEAIPEDHLRIEVESIDENTRRLSFSAMGASAVACLESFNANQD
jgi:tRNA threonylcarbamoyladenosine biosynthesis protein TsaE